MKLVTGMVNMNVNTQRDLKISYVFVFLEVFEHEGGIQSYIRQMLASYAALNPSLKSQVFILRDSPRSTPPIQSDALTFRYLKKQSPWLGRVQLAWELFWFLIQHRPQRVLCGHVKLLPLLSLLCEPLQIPITVLTYGKEVWSPLPPRTQQLLQKANSIWSISRYSRDRSCAVNGLDAKKFELLPCCVEGQTFTPGPKSPKWVERYGLGDDRVLMTVARLWSGDPYKGVDVTIRALPEILKVFPNVKYLVIGRGDDQPRLAQLAQDLGLEKQVIFAGFVANEDLVEHYRLADAYVMPSQEGFGIVYLEAMSCGVPVISGDADGSADPLQDGKVGWCVPHRSPEAVAAACLEILKGGQQRCDGRWLREQALAAFSVETFTQHLGKLLELGQTAPVPSLQPTPDRR
ncbi:MAG: glycosyltransferase family 4 protein [Leptolyngbyaceae cyanobacterium bins.59]|nr:glycosyltransferase family 4 protein [Leptolyngbyaceae cyanobacterium bins.59]